MSNEFESMNTVPSLTLEPELEEKQELTVKAARSDGAGAENGLGFCCQDRFGEHHSDSAIRRSRPEENGRLFRCRSGQCEDPGSGGSGRSDRQRCRRAAGLRQRGAEGHFRILQKAVRQAGADEEPLRQGRSQCGEDQRRSAAAPGPAAEGLCGAGQNV